jgi:protein-S-isoprenylcysteine O-methyltransferase Ste14
MTASISKKIGRAIFIIISNRNIIPHSNAFQDASQVALTKIIVKYYEIQGMNGGIIIVSEAAMENSKIRLNVRTIVQMLVFIVLVPFLPLLISWDWGWWQAWAYGLIGVLGFVISRLLVNMRHPDLLAERAKFMQHENTKSWDEILARLVGLGGALIPLAAGLDAKYGWSQTDYSLLAELIALVLILIGYAFGSWALMENRFFSGTVRIQTERDHHVISSGPYAWVRHPGYAGALLTYFATPLLLDSPWTFVPVVFMTVVLVIRTSLEDRTLQEELPGYKEYATQQTKYRLLPGIW